MSTYAAEAAALTLCWTAGLCLGPLNSCGKRALSCTRLTASRAVCRSLRALTEHWGGGKWGAAESDVVDALVRYV